MSVDDILARLPDARPAADGWRSACPVHGGRSRPLSIRVTDDGYVLVHCFAACAPGEIRRALGIAEQRPGTSLGTPPPRRSSPRPSTAAAAPLPRSWLLYMATWHDARRAQGTVVERYLRGRGITVEIPAALRYLPRLKHAPSGRRWPAMIAMVELQGPSSHCPVALHRTFLLPDGTGKAPVEPSKMSLGPVRGAAVRLGEPGDTLVVAEGIETALSVMQETGVPAWAALSAGGIEALVLPPLPLASEIVVAADHDRVGLDAAHRAAERWTRLGRRVRVATPPMVGADFNDLLQGGTTHG